MKWNINTKGEVDIRHDDIKKNDLPGFFLKTILDSGNNNLEIILKSTKKSSIEKLFNKMIAECYNNNLVLDEVVDNSKTIYGDRTNDNTSRNWHYRCIRIVEDDENMFSYQFHFMNKNLYGHLIMFYDGYDF